MYFQAIKFAPVEYIATHHRATAQSWIFLKRIDVPTQRRWLYSTRRTQADQGIKTARSPEGIQAGYQRNWPDENRAANCPVSVNAFKQTRASPSHPRSHVQRHQIG